MALNIFNINKMIYFALLLICAVFATDADLLPNTEENESIITIIKGQIVALIPADDVVFAEKWKHTMIVLLIAAIAACMFMWIALWERLSRLRMALVIILLFIFLYTIQTFAA